MNKSKDESKSSSNSHTILGLFLSTFWNPFRELVGQSVILGPISHRDEDLSENHKVKNHKGNPIKLKHNLIKTKAVND